MVGVSSDGDNKLLRAMVHEASLPNGIVVMQDIIHIATKCRNRLLKLNIKLPMGNRSVTIDHLRQLLRKEQKSVHKLTYQDIFPVDRMNYSSFEKIVNDCVITSLIAKVPKSEATIQYLLTFRDIIDSFSKFDMEPLQRILFMYRSLYFIRIWRAYIKRSPFYNLENNFLTYNLYTCIELNAKALVHLMKMFRDSNREKEFLLALFDSQTCERLFRQIRSLGTTNFTKVNFDLLDLIYMINRIETQNDIVYSKLDIPGIEFPNKRRGKTKFYALPTDLQIYNTICQAKQEAIKKAIFFEMINSESNNEEIEKYEFHSTISMNVAEYECSMNETGQEYDLEYEDQLHYFKKNNSISDEDELNNRFNEDGDQDSDDMDETLDENSAFTSVIDKNGERKVVKKSTLLWMLTERTEKMSNDRSRRVQYD